MDPQVREQLTEAIEVLITECGKKQSFLHLPELDIKYFIDLMQFLNSALNIYKNNQTLINAKNYVISNRDTGKKFDHVANEVIDIINQEL
jgi:hypothetical protein